MKILYGIQGTGNGHISRANAMAKAFLAFPELEISWLLSGRPREQGCGTIRDFMWREGMTFAVKAGKIRVIDTLRTNNLIRFRRDVNNLDLEGYDLIISDFEPVISHAARKRGIPVTGIGHQYAFDYDIPKKGENGVTRAIMKSFAPVTQAAGLHWYHFGFPILPPILDIELPEALPAPEPAKVIVYLPFENPGEIIGVLSPNRGCDFYIYHPAVGENDDGNIHTRPISRQFKTDLLSASRVITNSGFELISECLHLGKMILSKPLRGQMEQLSNARAMEILNYATVIDTLDPQKISAWLSGELDIVKVEYPDVAAALAGWVAGGCRTPIADLSSQLWGQQGQPSRVA